MGTLSEIEKSRNEFHTARYEVKHTAQTGLIADIDAWIMSHPALFSQAYPDRVVNNLYFDTYDLDAFQENQAGVAKRSKLRLRWYGSTKNPKQAQLELKQRCGKLGWKTICPIHFDKDFETIAWEDLFHLLHKQVSDELMPHLALNNVPSLYNTYHRRYFVSGDNRVRLTLDSDISAFDQRIVRSLNSQIPCVYPKILVIEVKGATEDRELIGKVLANNKIPLSRCSKYAVGVQSMLYY